VMCIKTFQLISFILNTCAVRMLEDLPSHDNISLFDRLMVRSATLDVDKWQWKSS